MSKKWFLTIFIWLVLSGWVRNALPEEILVVQGIRIKPYSDALAGFRSAVGSRFRGIDYTIRDIEDVAPYLQDYKPDLVLAIGMDALKSVAKLQDIPVIYLMVLNPSHEIGERRDVTGVSMNIAPDKQLGVIRKVFPGAQRVGLLYDPRKSLSFVKRAQKAARELKIDLLAREVTSSRSVADALNSLKGTIDVFWMIPDTTVLTSETVELIMLHSLENRLPVCSFSTKYLEMGALMSLDINSFDMGKQAGVLAAKILSGVRVAELPAVDADTFSLTINESVARKLKIYFSNEVRGMARIYR